MPYYSIEAWLYQNTREGARLCAQGGCSQHLDPFRQWELDRGLLDEVEQPKEQVCFRSAHNARLAAEGFPADAVFAADKSFAAAVTSLLESAELCQALALTHL